MVCTLPHKRLRNAKQRRSHKEERRSTTQLTRSVDLPPAQLVHRYCGGAPNDVFRGAELRLTPDAAAALRAGSPFASFLALRLPRAVAANLASAVWALACRWVALCWFPVT